MDISVVIPVYNTEKYIAEALDSILNQTVSVTEIVIIDDCSKDYSLKIICEYQKKYSNIRVIKNSCNLGVSASRNKAVNAAKGEWILFLDADDLVDKRLIQTYSAVLQIDECEAIYSQFTQIDEDGQTVSSIQDGVDLIRNDGFCRMFIRNPIISPSGSFVKKSVFSKLNGFDEAMWSAEDVDFWLRILLAGGTIKYLEKPLSLIRRHNSNTTGSINVTNIGERAILDKYDTDFIKERLFKREFINNTQNYLDYANVLIRYKKNEEALKVLSRIELENKDKKYCSLLFMKSLVYITLERFEEAESCLYEIININPKHGAALNNYGVLMALKSDYINAIKFFEEAKVHFTGYVDAEYNISQIINKESDFRYTLRELRQKLLRYS